MLFQRLSPCRKLFFSGEKVTFFLENVPSAAGYAAVRTNIGRAAVRRMELIEQGENERSPRGSDWHDLPMLPVPGQHGTYTLTLPLPEVGIFEAKCCFIPADGSALLWPEGENFHLKVSAAANISGNGIYCAFVRQYLPGVMEKAFAPSLPDFSKYDEAGFTVVPPSGTFRTLRRQLDHIFGELNCRILQLLPVHPVPVSYARMGRYGSPFAATDYFAVDPALAEFDPAATPMEQFQELIDAVHQRCGRIFMDIPVNHTGWASKLQNEHPEYFVRDHKHNFESPGAWGVVWADLCKLDYHRQPVQEVMAKVFLFWCRRGVDGFRCDAGYMVPQEAWNVIIAKVRREYPDTVFLLEGLGGPPAIQEKLLAQSGMDWAYSELFQNFTRDEISRYYPCMNDTGNRCGTLASFAETHDNLRLAAGGKNYARVRFLVTALLSQHGTFGFANGAEYFAAEKIDVHGCGALNYGSKENLNALIGRLNLLLASHPAFSVGAEVKLIQQNGGNVIAALRSGKNIPELLILINLEPEQPVNADFTATGHNNGRDLLSGREISLLRNGKVQSLLLGPGEGVCISFDNFKLPETVEEYRYPAKVKLQLAHAMAQRAALKLYGIDAAAKADGGELLADPEKFTAGLSGITPAPVTLWQYPADMRRQVMLPPGDALLVRSPYPFILELTVGKTTVFHANSLTTDREDHSFVLCAPPQNQGAKPETATLKLTLFTPDKVQHITSTLLLLPEAEKCVTHLAGSWKQAQQNLVFGTNASGSYAMFSAAFGKVNSKYDAILAVNPNREHPVDRHVVFNSCRAWLVINGYSHELNGTTLEKFAAHPGNRAKWFFSLPGIQGGRTGVQVNFRMAQNADAVELRFKVESAGSANLTCARLILRPDMEERANHQLTRAIDGAEHTFVNCVKPLANGFDFTPYGNQYSCRLSKGEFHFAPEWRYMVDLPAERYYGLADKTDLFSPGFCTIDLATGEEVTLTFTAGEYSNAAMPPETVPEIIDPDEIAVEAISRFIVRRDGLSTVIAGYPWFLDWGRDTLIALRGIVRFPEFAARAREIVLRFAAFEKDGTIPNMICGGNDSNRDTSDAPLYLIIAVRDYISATGDESILTELCSGRPLLEVLGSIVENYRRGTPNGIIMDEKSKLIFSPSHFSWMDTNFPAGTPREGYPIEIQTLWYAALEFLGEKELANEVSDAIEKYFFSDGKVSDCLHCKPGTPAEAARRDDHVRSNMLLAITLNAVKDEQIKANILRQAATLLIPGAIRTLADAPVEYPLPIYHQGRLLNNPRHPYQGEYKGDEDTKRKIAYHNGTAWCWPFPAYCEALYMLGGEKSRRRALSLLMSANIHLENGIPGELPEVVDGDLPHRSGGCPAQAWSITEFYRVRQLLCGK